MMKFHSSAPEENYVAHLTPEECAQLIEVLGEGCAISYLLTDREKNVLWDTGAQISIFARIS